MRGWEVFQFSPMDPLDGLNFTTISIVNTIKVEDRRQRPPKQKKVLRVAVYIDRSSDRLSAGKSRNE